MENSNDSKLNSFTTLWKAELQNNLNELIEAYPNYFRNKDLKIDFTGQINDVIVI